MIIIKRYKNGKRLKIFTSEYVFVTKGLKKRITKKLSLLLPDYSILGKVEFISTDKALMRYGNSTKNIHSSTQNT